MPPAFGPLLADAIKRSGLTQRDFAAKVGLTQAYISMLIKGKRAILHAGVNGWPELLGLAKYETDEFLLSADLTRTTPRLMEWIRTLVDNQRV